MHTQTSLHISDSKYDLIDKTLSSKKTVKISDIDLVKILVEKGVFEYQAQKMVEQRQSFQQKTY
jgi:hypothetical protein